MKKQLYRSLIELSSNRVNSYVLRRFSTSKASKYLNKSFAKTFNIDEAEMEKPLHEYKSLQELFIRNLKEGARKIDDAENSVVSPVDAVVADVGEITEDLMFHVKNQDYSIVEMLGNEKIATKYKQGTYAILYLSPSHYHRIHTPFSGTVVGKWALGNKSYPVNTLGLHLGKRPLSKNYRLITEIKLATGKHYSVVKVGALNVNSIQLTYRSTEVKKGEELGYFTFGSTVILLFEKDTVQFEERIAEGQDVKVGMKIATLL